MKIHKNKLKIVLSVLLCLAILWGNGMVSYAAGETVTITSASASTTTVTVAGDTLAAAVMVQIRDASDVIVAMQSFGTLDDKFSGSITGLSLTAGASYTVYVADYEGGTWSTTDVVAVAPPAAASAGTENTATGSATTAATATASTEAVTSTAPVESVQTEAPKSPKTGDNSGVLYGCVFVMGIVLFRRYMLYRQK
ncbi:MAG: hypothetical protein ACI4F0_08755 [Agathobacter sp.]